MWWEPVVVGASLAEQQLLLLGGGGDSRGRLGDRHGWSHGWTVTGQEELVVVVLALEEPVRLLDDDGAGLVEQLQTEGLGEAGLGVLGLGKVYWLWLWCMGLGWCSSLLWSGCWRRRHQDVGGG